MMSTMNFARTLRVQRFAHAHKDLRNAVADNLGYFIFVDGVNKGSVAKGQYIDIPISGQSHEIALRTGLGSPSPLNVSKITIPAGAVSFFVTAFNATLSAGPLNDPFGGAVTEFVLKMFRSQGARDRIDHPNNRNRNLYVNLYSDRIEISYDVVKTRGFEQWSTGREIEKIPYSRLGLPPPANGNAYNYWNFLTTMVKDSIVEDDQADMEKDSLGGFRPRTVHRMW